MKFYLPRLKFPEIVHVQMHSLVPANATPIALLSVKGIFLHVRVCKASWTSKTMVFKNPEKDKKDGSFRKGHTS